MNLIQEANELLYKFNSILFVKIKDRQINITDLIERLVLRLEDRDQALGMLAYHNDQIVHKMDIYRLRCEKLKFDNKKYKKALVTLSKGNRKPVAKNIALRALNKL